MSLLLALGGYLAVGKINEIILTKNSNTIWQLKIYSKVRTLLTVHKKDLVARSLTLFWSRHIGKNLLKSTMKPLK